MNKKRFLLLILLLFIPFIVRADDVCDIDKISIESIELVNKTDNIIGATDTYADGKNIVLNLEMAEIGDSVQYEFVVKNESNDDFEINSDSLNLNSDFLEYQINSDDNSNIVKANSSKVLYLKVEYKEEVPSEKFENGVYNDNKTIVVNLSTNEIVEDLIENPNTRTGIIILIISIVTLIGSFIAFVLLKKKEYLKMMALIFGMVMAIPVTVYALCECDITIESNVQIVVPGEDPVGPYYNLNLRKNYSNLEPAVLEASDNHTIIVLEEAYEEEPVTIPAGLVGLKLDLNGNIIHFESIQGEHPITNNAEIDIINSSDEQGEIRSFSDILNKGTLSIKGDVLLFSENSVFENEGELNIFAGEVHPYEANGIRNTGVVNISGGIVGGNLAGIINENILNVSGGEVSGAYGINNGDNAQLNISGDTLISGYRYAISNSGTLIVDGGEIKGRGYDTTYALINNGVASLTNVNINWSTVGNYSWTYAIDNRNGQLDLYSGTVTSTVEGGGTAITIKNTANLVIHDGTISAIHSNHDGIAIKAEGTSVTSILDGEINSTYYAISLEGNYTLTLGNDDGNVSTTNPVISASGINGIGIVLGTSDNATFNYYDGLIKSEAGAEKCLSSHISSINLPNGYEIVKEKIGSIWIASLVLTDL